MTQPPVTVRLDPRRLDQLKAIASAMKLTNAGVIAALIRDKIAEGVIPADIPGTEVRKVANGVTVSLREGDETTMTAAGARKLATTIREVVAGNAAPTTINPGFNFSVHKQGTGLKVVLPFGGANVQDAVAFPPDLALDLADLIEKAAA
ncbi:hypothetical protein A4U53_022755 [Rhizobium ruizarguesonis]|uniref:Uncharacterized protein n=2 Tax=Rhizobium TaxID=379 RepID=A0A179BAZ7_RHILE|nr:hypothetical protein [Rhizobium leguminosarum]OAP88184.1 hypothetical protein A4U53_08735 [Rhizobium leguminosarum]QND20401.1 hypothetical protein HB774_09985 [Rhizobium leguminosarum bv. viciae]